MDRNSVSVIEERGTYLEKWMRIEPLKIRRRQLIILAMELGPKNKALVLQINKLLGEEIHAQEENIDPRARRHKDKGGATRDLLEHS